jgi:nicotinamidase-related amidase
MTTTDHAHEIAAPPLLVGRPALLIIDMQNDFVDPASACYTPGSEDLTPVLGRLAGAARAADVPVIFTQEAHRPGRVDSGRELDPGTGASYPGGGPDSRVPEHCVEGTAGIEIIPALRPEPADLHLRKRRYSCFVGTDLDLLLGNLGVETLLITGVLSNVCVLWTVGDAFQRDYHVRVIEDAIAGSSPEEHESAVRIMRALTVGERGIHSSGVLAALEARAEARLQRA